MLAILMAYHTLVMARDMSGSTKVTFTIDDETVGYLGKLASYLGRPKSQVVREAIRAYGEQISQLSNEERDRLLETFDRVTAAIPERPRAELEREMQALRTARRRGGRGGARDVTGHEEP